MKIVWGREQVTVRDVYETILERRKIAYTTVLTMLRILEEKGYLTKSASDSAALSRGDSRAPHESSRSDDDDFSVYAPAHGARRL